MLQEYTDISLRQAGPGLCVCGHHNMWGLLMGAGSGLLRILRPWQFPLV